MARQQRSVHDDTGQGDQQGRQAEQKAGHGTEGLVEEQVGRRFGAGGRNGESGSRTVWLSTGLGIAFGRGQRESFDASLR